MKKFIRSIWPTAAMVAAFALICLLLHLFVFHMVRVEGTSMVDTLRSGDMVLVTRFDYMGGRQPDRGDIVVEPFSGSGTTIIACEQSERVCYAMERSPEYCDLAVKRWEQFTGQKAERISSDVQG